MMDEPINAVSSVHEPIAKHAGKAISNAMICTKFFTAVNVKISLYSKYL
jgi:hypothetical protein